ncbi:MAG: GGDEF domain-containing protein [Bacteroidales bacterium]|nr:GGDEF domain-containing protein [Lachnoclostridium sp.]MCM1383973.1 GGDEF domain-containing protein [Lachnoclostridium sp.]MCM1464682.1 GGDEF domain-containing protein [Bacteroidales bacterium]
MKDKITLKNILRVLWILTLLGSVIIWLPKVDGLLSKDYQQISDYVSLDDHWEITVNGEVYHDVSLEGFLFDSVKKGEEIVMTRVLPKDLTVTEGVLRFNTRHCAVRVYIDDEQVYEYGYDRMAQNKSVGSGFLFVNCPEEYAGRTLTIKYCLVENKSLKKISSVRIYPWENAYRVLLTENRLPTFIGSFLVIFGIVIGLITMFAVLFSTKYIRMLCISLFSICMGLWTLCYYDVLLVFAVPLYSVSLLEHVALYLAPLPLVVYVYEDVRNMKHKLLHIFHWIILAFQILSLAVIMGLHTVDRVHLTESLHYEYGLIIICLIYFGVVITLSIKNSKLLNRLYLLGLLIICCCTVYDMLSYQANVHYGGTSFFSLKGVLSIGVLALIFILFIGFYIEMTQKMMQEAERNSLIRRAYTDELTGLHNRRYCIEYLDKIKEEEKFNFTIICFDVNNLKTVNDTYGHAKGDILIKSAADVIAEIFEEWGVVARMGGDEFIAVINTSKEDKIKELIERFQANIEKKNKQIEDLNMSIAWGYAFGSQTEVDIDKVYQEADDRMYECKRQMKLERKI